MNDVNMAAFTAPKTDQANYDDFIAGPRTITITAVKANEGAKEQPVSVYFEGDNGKPYKPCLSMRRVMVHVWGADAKQYIGRSMTLYGDPTVQWGGMAVGGIRISHMSHMSKPQTMALTATKAKRAPFTVQPLVQTSGVQEMIDAYGAATVLLTWDSIENDRRHAWPKLSAQDKAKLKAASDEAKSRLTTTSATDDQEPPPGMQEETL